MIPLRAGTWRSRHPLYTSLYVPLRRIPPVAEPTPPPVPPGSKEPPAPGSSPGEGTQ